jgi:phosphoesterase RecJ-like protein
MKHVAQKINREIINATDVLIVMHQNPDGDTLGTSMAMFEYINTLKNKNITVFCLTDIPKNLNFLPHIHVITQDKKVLTNKYDIAIMLDISKLDYAGAEDLLQNKPKYIVNIDHHKTNQYYGDLNMIDENASATAEVLYHFFKFNNLDLSPKQATSLLTGLITDTDNFTNLGTTTTAVMIAGELIRLGANLKNINTKTVKNKTVNSLKLWGVALSRLTKHQTMDLAHTHLTQADFKEHETDEDEADGISNFLNNLEEAKIALVLKETKDGKIKGSLRTTHNDIDVSKIAQSLGGGGHKKAAGFTTTGTVDEILERISRVYKESQIEV